MHFTVDEASDQTTPTVVELQSCDQVARLLPISDSSSVNSPQPDGLISTAAGDAELLCNVEDGARDDTFVSKLLDRASVIQVPNDDFHICTCCQQVILVRLFGTPIDV